MSVGLLHPQIACLTTRRHRGLSFEDVRISISELLCLWTIAEVPGIVPIAGIPPRYAERSVSADLLAGHREERSHGGMTAAPLDAVA
jgi:hypothetical protein